MRVTIKDVAKESGLAISTISKYINGGTVLLKNRKKIENAIKKLGYSPNNTARSLRTSKSYMIGIITGPMNNPHISTIVNEIENFLRDHGYSVSFVCLDHNSKHSKKHIEYMIEQGVDGWIICPFHGSKTCLDPIKHSNLPAVVLEENYEDSIFDCVQVNCANGAYQLIEYLIKMRHKNIAIINGPKDQLTSKERLRGYLRALQDYHIPICKDYIIQGDFSYQTGYQGIEQLWNLEKHPSAIFVSNYNICLGAVSAIHELNIKIPDELSLVSFDDFELSMLIKPHLTTVSQPLKQLAIESAALLIKRIKDDYSDFPAKIRLSPNCNVRDSAKPLNSVPKTQ